MKQIETIMKTRLLGFQPPSPCLRFFIQTLLAEPDTEIMIEELLLADDAIVGSAAFASSAPLAAAVVPLERSPSSTVSPTSIIPNTYK